MNARSVSKSAGRRPGMAITVILLALAALRQGRAADVNYTITGVLTGGWDQFAIFLKGKEAQDMAKQPFTLVFTFDDSKGRPHAGKADSSLSGGGVQSGGKAVLTIGSGSYTFGGDVYSGWSVYRAPGLIVISVNEAKGSFFDFAPAVDVRIVPARGGKPFGTDWKAPLSTTTIDNAPSCFIITHRGDRTHEVKGCFDVQKVEVAGPKSWWPF